MITFSLIGVLSAVHLISLLISIVAVVVLYRSYKTTHNLTVKYFMWFFVFVFAWMAVYFITIRLTTGTFTETKGWILATSHGFFLIGLAFLARIVAMFSMPKKEKLIFWITLVAAIGVTLLGLFLRYTAADPATIKQANGTIIQISAALTVLVLVPSFLLFFYRSFTASNEIITIRSFLIGAGFALLLWHGISLVLIPIYGVMPWLMGEALNVLAFALILSGILYNPAAGEKEELSGTK